MDSDEQTLAGYRGWLRKVAAGMTTPDLTEDLAQEGWIEMWRALRSYDPTRGARPAWLTFKALGRMRDCITDQAWLGRPRRHLGRGRIRDSAEYATEPADLVWDQLYVPDVLDSILLAYHHGQIMAAIDRLTPAQRHYVRLRFWYGLRGAELTAVFGYDPHSLWTSPVNGARGKLAADLASLQSHAALG